MKGERNLQLMIGLIALIILYLLITIKDIRFQKTMFVLYSMFVVLFSVYARVDLDIIIVFIVLLNGVIFSMIISGLGIAEGITGLSLVYIAYRMEEIGSLKYAALVLWSYVTLILAGIVFTYKNKSSIKLVKNLTNDITARDYSSHKTIKMEVGDKAKVIEELRPLGKIQKGSEIAQAREITNKLVRTSTKVTVVEIIGNTALVEVEKDNEN